MSLLIDALTAAELLVTMAWDTWWALVLGFGLSGAVEAFVSEDAMGAVLGGDDWRTVGNGALLGAASSSCSYSAVGTAKTLFTKGASGVASLGAFMFASTDLVVELGVVLWVLLGWQFVVGEYLGGVVAVVVLAAVFRYLVPDDWIEAAREHARATDEPVCGTCDVTVDPTDPETVRLAAVEATPRQAGSDDASPDEADSGEKATAEPVYFCCGGCRRVYVAREGGVGDADQDAVGSTDQDGGDGPAGLRSRLLSVAGWQSAARASMKDWEMLWRDIALGFLVAALVGGFVPDGWWAALFPSESTFAGVVAATLVAIAIGVVTFMCSVGNVPFALVLWQNGLPYGAVLSFIYADLLIPPLVNVYRKYYGLRLAATLVGALAFAAAVAGVVVHYVVGGLGIVPPAGTVGGTVPDGYTTALNLVFTPIFGLQVVATYGLATVHRRVRDAVARVVAAGRRAIRGSARAVELATGAVAGVVADPRALPAAMRAEFSAATVAAPAATARRGVDLVLAGVTDAALALAGATARVTRRLEATRRDGGDHERPDRSDESADGAAEDDSQPPEYQ